MERLTKIIKCPDGTNIYDFSEKVAKKYITDHKGGVRALFEKLAQYEDTGLAPEQIQEIDRLYKEKCRELEKAKSPGVNRGR